MTSNKENQYIKYLENEVGKFKANQDTRCEYLVNEVSDLTINNILDVGCGAGQELLPFADMEGVLCIGVDVEESAGRIFRKYLAEKHYSIMPAFICSRGEEIPFDNHTFDVVICRVALPYMNNRRAIAEMSRVIRPGGVLLLRTHTPNFYLGMMIRRSREMSLKGIAYPIICFIGGTWHWITGRQLERGLWKGKEIFQTTGLLKKELRHLNMQIVKNELSQDGEARSYVIEKIK
ncbi:MAG: class I SAM-dependent methyltransferase [Acidobacteria bacterium]|nr:class I SAM-dependent methyltransferase [Acidobacteriota bacterium]